MTITTHSGRATGARIPATPPARQRRRRTATLATWAALAAAGGGAQAAEIDTGNPDWSLRWDNTLKASTLIRVKDADASLTDSFNAAGGPQALNLNAGDQNFRKKGFVSERLDLLTEFDAVYRRNVGLRVSAAGWYDAAYTGRSDAPNDPFNGQNPPNAFPSHTTQIAGRKTELLDAFVFGSFDLGGAGRLTTRLGQHTLLYGESLFFGDNGIAAAQGPVDILKLLSSPNAQFKEIAMPVPQVSATWQLNATVTLGGYYQFRWRESRVPPAGSYFSSANIPWGATGPEFVSVPAFVPVIGGNYRLTPGLDEQPKDSGQFGLQLKWRLDETDLGFYIARYHDKTGQLFSRADPGAPLTGSRWNYVFLDGVRTVGVSASRSVGDFNFAGEASLRDNMPLNVNNAVYFAPEGAPRPAVPTGKTAHLNLSTLATFGDSVIAKESSLVAELAWNRVLSKSDPDGEIDKGRTRSASIVQAIYTPTYRQALPGLDLNVPIGLRYTLSGNSSITAWQARHNGSATFGLEGNYLNTWQLALNYTHYLGSSVPFNDYAAGYWGLGNPLGDRDYIALSVRRTF